jgi:tagatose-6-phosphate ketose/aldose isomerase
VIHRRLGTLAEVAKAPFRRVLFLGSGSHFAGAREAALKMLEMTAGRVSAVGESYLGLRHGPVMCLLSSHPTLLAYVTDLLLELDDVAIECQGLRGLGAEDFAVIGVIAGRLLALFRCLGEGLRPDSPSEDGVISRVVQTFALYCPKN